MLDSDLNSMIYVFSGNVTIPRETRVKTQPHVIGLGVKQSINDGELGFKEIKLSNSIIINDGELNEPIARYGPFVMNTKRKYNKHFLIIL